MERLSQPQEPVSLEEALGNVVRSITGEEPDPEKIAEQAERIRTEGLDSSPGLSAEEADQLGQVQKRFESEDEKK